MSTSVYIGNIPGFYYVLKQTKPTTTTTVFSLYGERSTFLRNVGGGGGGGGKTYLGGGGGGGGGGGWGGEEKHISRLGGSYNSSLKWYQRTRKN